MEGDNHTEISYSPSAILSLFNNALSISQEKKIVLIKGIFIQGRGNNYNGFYYDQLKDESSDSVITLIVPELIRNRLSNNKTIIFWGYITRRVVNKGGRIDLHLNLSELLEQTHNKYNEDEIKSLELLKIKAEKGYVDVSAYIKQKIIANERVGIKIIIGRTAIIDKDIYHQLEETIGVYNIEWRRFNFSSEQEIVKAINESNLDNLDILCIARGGGENVGLFDKPSISEASININPKIVTAIGHKDDSTLLEKVADKGFITPTAFGQYLNDLYNDTIAELQNSKARLVEEITKSLKANYDKQVQNLTEQLAASGKQKEQLINELKLLNEKEKQLLSNNIKSLSEQNKEKDQLLLNYKRQIDSLQTQLSRIPTASPSGDINWVYVVAIIIAGLIIGMATCN